MENLKAIVYHPNILVNERMSTILELTCRIHTHEVYNSFEVVPIAKRELANQRLRQIVESIPGLSETDFASETQQKEADLFVLYFDSEDRELVEFIARAKIGIPVFIIGDKPTPEKLFEKINLIGHAEIDNSVAKNVAVQLNSCKKPAIDARKDQSYFGIKSSLVLKMSPIIANIFVKAGEDKYLPTYSKGQKLKRDPVMRLNLERKAKYLFIENRERGETIKKLQSDLDILLHKGKAKGPSVKNNISEIASEANELVQELITNIGFDAKTQETARTAVQMTIKSARETYSLKKLIEEVMEDENHYMPGHSIALGQIACCLAITKGWDAQETLAKLCTAAFFHDLKASRDLAKYQSLEDLQFAVQEGIITNADMKKYLTHPLEAAEVLRKIKELPPEVDVIVEQHHETPDGTGFPRKTGHAYISQISCLFIISHDMVSELYKVGSRFSLFNFFQSRKEIYNKGNFRRVINELVQNTKEDRLSL